MSKREMQRESSYPFRLMLGSDVITDQQCYTDAGKLTLCTTVKQDTEYRVPRWRVRTARDVPVVLASPTVAVGHGQVVLSHTNFLQHAASALRGLDPSARPRFENGPIRRALARGAMNLQCIPVGLVLVI